MIRILFPLIVLWSVSHTVLGEQLYMTEIVYDGRAVLRADRAANANQWTKLNRTHFTSADPSGPFADPSTDHTVTLKGPVVIRAGRVGARLNRLRLVSAGQAKTWRVHPADALQLTWCPELARLGPTDDKSLEIDIELRARPLVIAHRGASGYLPEHTVQAACLAYGMRADVLEQDVITTRDGVPIVCHDIYLDTVTNVAKLFPQRARGDGRWYAIDFTLSEIRSLNVNERVTWPGRTPVFAGRFPQQLGDFRIATFAEMIELVQGLNHSTGQRISIYPEIKQPEWHRQHGQDLSAKMLAVLKQYGYSRRYDPVFLQCFDAAELRRLRDEVNCQLTMVQLISDSDADRATVTAAGLAKVAEYADAIGPALSLIFAPTSSGQPEPTELVSRAHRLGMFVHPYTVRRDDVYQGFTDDIQLIEACRSADVDGMFCDFPDRALSILHGGQVTNANAPQRPQNSLR